MNPPYFQEGIVLAPHATTGFNQALWTELCLLAEEVAQVLGKDLIAVVLGGGYGRGEGCVIRREGKQLPYNDVDLFLVTTTPHPSAYRNLHPVAEKYEKRLQIAVDFSRPQTPEMISEWSTLLMWQELLLGHRVLYGPDDVLTAHPPLRLLQPLPVAESSRLLLNRGAGLIWAARVLMDLEPSPDATFVVRNYFKCAQSIADAILIGHGNYASRQATKEARLAELQDKFIVHQTGAVAHMHRANAFRKDPLAETQITVTHFQKLAEDWLCAFLWAESLRHVRLFKSVDEYLAWSGQREAEEISFVQSVAANLRRKQIGWRHPREKVYRTLPAAISDLAHARTDFDTNSYLALQYWRDAQ